MHGLTLSEEIVTSLPIYTRLLRSDSTVWYFYGYTIHTLHINGCEKKVTYMKVDSDIVTDSIWTDTLLSRYTVLSDEVELAQLQLGMLPK